VAGQAVLQLQELLEQCCTITREISEIHTSFCAADRRHEGNGQHFKQVVPLGIAAAWIRQIRKTGIQPTHRPLRRKEPIQESRSSSRRKNSVS
jgi:hypothetical protein